MRKIIIIVVVVLISSVLFITISKLLKKAEPVRIAALTYTNVHEEAFEGLKKGLSDLGYIEGKNIVYLFQTVNGNPKEFPAAFKKIIEFKPDLIYTASTPATMAAKKYTETNKIPVVFGPVNNPVSTGLLPSIMHPGGNITGIQIPPGDGRRLHFFLKVIGSSKNILFPYFPNDPSAISSLNQVMQEVNRSSIKLIEVPLSSKDEMDDLIRNFPEEVDALFLPMDSLVGSRVEEFIKAALGKKIPVCVPSTRQMEFGALFSYGVDQYQIGIKTAKYVQMILKGVKPSEIPVATAEKFSFINMATARKLGLKIDDDILRQIDNIIY